MVRQPAAHCPKKLPDNSIIFAAEATAISLALNYYQHIGPMHYDVVVYSDSMSCLQAIEGEDTENPFICHIMNLLRLLSDKGTHVRFCSIPSHCDIEGNERVDQLAKETHDQDIDSLASIHYTDMKQLVNSYIQKWGQTKWDVAVHGRDLYIVKPTFGSSPPNPTFFSKWPDILMGNTHSISHFSQNFRQLVFVWKLVKGDIRLPRENWRPRQVLSVESIVLRSL